MIKILTVITNNNLFGSSEDCSNQDYVAELNLRQYTTTPFISAHSICEWIINMYDDYIIKKKKEKNSCQAHK